MTCLHYAEQTILLFLSSSACPQKVDSAQQILGFVFTLWSPGASLLATSNRPSAVASILLTFSRTLKRRSSGGRGSRSWLLVIASLASIRRPPISRSRVFDPRLQQGEADFPPLQIHIQDSALPLLADIDELTGVLDKLCCLQPIMTWVEPPASDIESCYLQANNDGPCRVRYAEKNLEVHRRYGNWYLYWLLKET